MGSCLLPTSRALPASTQRQLLYGTHRSARTTGSAAQTARSGGSGSGGARWRCHCSIICCSSKHESGDQQDSGAADKSSSTSSSSSSSPQQRTPRRRRKAGNRREDYAFAISRADLSWEQPWLFDQSASLPELRLREQGLTALDDAAAAAEEQPLAAAKWRVQLPTGLGALVVDGTVTAALPLRCEFCGEPLERALEAVPFDVVIYLGDSGAELAANELVFDLDLGFVDITPVVCDALLGSLPTVCLCGGASCAQHAGKEVAWTAPATAPAAASSPFAKLLAGGGGAGSSSGKSSGGSKKGKRR